MPTLVSPGVSVTVVDESQYAAATQGTLPLIVVATATNKTDASGSAIASGTLEQNARVAYLVSSQRELVETFGEPKFYEVGGSVVQGAETSEYGLLAAYQYLGVSNNAYVLRAPIDLAQLEATTSEPAGAITSGTYWHDTSASKFGVFRHDGTDWVAYTPKVLYDAPGTGNVEAVNADGFASPVNTYGSAGDIAIVASTVKITYWEKVGVNWVVLGDTGSADFQFSKFAPTTQSDGTSALSTGNVYVRLATQGAGLDLAVSVYDASSGLFTSVQAPTYASDDLAGADLIDAGDVYVRYNATKGFVELRRHTGKAETSITSGVIPNTSSITADFT